jgi:hypothetical protein
MGQRGHKIREAIAHLAHDGCDLTDPSVAARLRADDVAFHLGYLEEDCGFRLTTDEVVGVIRTMMKELEGRPLGAPARSEFVGLLFIRSDLELYN